VREKRGGEKERDIFHACTFARYYPFVHFPLLQLSMSLIGFSCISVDPSVSQPTGSKHWQKKMKVKLWNSVKNAKYLLLVAMEFFTYGSTTLLHQHMHSGQQW